MLQPPREPPKIQSDGRSQKEYIGRVDHAVFNELRRPVTSGHVFVVATGFGKRVIPRSAQFQFSIGAEGSLVLAVENHEPTIVGREQGVAAAQAAVLEVADITEGPTWSRWWLQTYPYRVPLPQDWTAYASGSVDPSAFDLVGPQNSLMFIQTPGRVPAIDQLVGPGQRSIGKGLLTAGEWITVQYVHEGISYFQRHIQTLVRRTVAILTLQCREDAFTLVEPTQRFLADAILPGEP